MNLRGCNRRGRGHTANNQQNQDSRLQTLAPEVSGTFHSPHPTARMTPCSVPMRTLSLGSVQVSTSPIRGPPSRLTGHPAPKLTDGPPSPSPPIVLPPAAKGTVLDCTPDHVSPLKTSPRLPGPTAWARASLPCIQGPQTIPLLSVPPSPSSTLTTCTQACGLHAWAPAGFSPCLLLQNSQGSSPVPPSPQSHPGIRPHSRSDFSLL